MHCMFKLYPGAILTDEKGNKFVAVPLLPKSEFQSSRLAPDQIKTLRKHRGWTQSDLAQHSGLTQATISNIEKGKEKPNPSTCIAIEAALFK